MDLNVPVQCAGVLVMPGDVLVGDPSGVIVVPQALAAEVAEKGYETDMRDAFSRMKVLQGVSVDEVFPLKPSYQQEYEAWRSRQTE
jgi:regulator of RNase E activity RraA